MSFSGDDRAVAIQIGAMLLFAVLVIAMASYQATVVPNQNSEVEFNHNQEVQNQLQDLRNGIVSTAGGSDGSAHSVSLGTSYPPRTLFVNPGPPGGQLRTLGTHEILIENATATAGGSVGEYWNGANQTLNTTAFAYRPNYHELDEAPTTVYEHSLLYNAHPTGGNTTVADQILVDGDEITLVTLEGEIQESTSSTVSVNVRRESGSNNALSVTNASDGPISITVPTRSPDAWNQSLPDHATITDTTDAGTYTIATITLDPDEHGSYDLRMARARVGGSSGTESPDTAAEYLVEIDDGGPVSNGEPTTVVAEVRDRHNNPVSNATLWYSINTGSSQKTTTDGQGRVDIEAEGGDDVKAWINESGYSAALDYETFELRVPTSGGGGGGSYTLAYNWTDTGTQEAAIECYEGNSTCVYDVNADGDNTFTLFTETSPSVTGADIDFAHNGSTAVDRTANEDAETDDNGEATADLEATGTPRDAEVYVSTTVDSATMLVRVVGSLAELDVAFAGTSDNWAHGLDNDGNRTTATNSGQAEAIGPPRVDFDGDGLVEMPYVNGSNGLSMIDRNNETTSVLTSGVKKTGIVTGTWDGSTTSVFYANSNDGDLYRTDVNGNTQRIAGFSNPVISVAGIGDFDNDSADEIATVVNGELGIVDDDGNTYTEDIDIGSNNNRGIGEPADFNGDGQVRLPVVTGGNDLSLVNCQKKNKNKFDCTQTNVASDLASKTVVAQYDWTENGQPEIVFANKNDNNRLYYAEVSGDTATVTRIGSGIKIYPEAGVR
jgi:hypothetical protein